MSAGTRLTALLVLALIGLADAVYLTWDHFSYLADPANFGGGLCGTGGGCDISRTSGLSELPLGFVHVPISLLAAAFYIAFGALAWHSHKVPDEKAPRRLLLGLALAATAYSLFLGGYSLVAQGKLCEYCSVLYVVNLGLLFVTWRTRGEPAGAWARGAVGSAFTVYGLVSALIVIVVVTLVLVITGDPRGDAPPDVLGSPSVTIDTTDRPTKGSPNAPVHIVEFADLQCPHCRVLFNTLEDLVKKRPDDVRVTFMHFPLDQACNPALKRDFHKRACAMSRVTDCAAAQGRFFEVAGALFQAPRDPDDAALRTLAVGAGAKDRALDACLADPAVDTRVLSDIKTGLKLGITGTPVFFINGHKIVGARPLGDIEALVDRILAASR